VTGGAGFIGSHLVNRLVLYGNEVTVFDNLSSGRISYLRDLVGRPGFVFVKGDLLDLDSVRHHIADHDFVFHLASNPDIAKGTISTDLDLKQGIVATYNVLEAMRLAGVDKILYTSGSGVYGDLGGRATSEDFGPLIPISLYGASKLACEGLIGAFCHMFDMHAWVFRMANVVGPRQTHGVVLDFIKKLRSNPKELAILGDGCQRKSYVWVEDCLDGFFLALQKSNERVNVFNLASEDLIDVRSIAKIVIHTMGLEEVALTFTGGSRGWKGDVPVVKLPIEKMKRLGWKPSMTSEKAIIEAAKALIRNIDQESESSFQGT